MPSSLAVHHTRHESCGSVSRVTQHHCDTGHDVMLGADSGASGLRAHFANAYFCTVFFVTFNAQFMPIILYLAYVGIQRVSKAKHLWVPSFIAGTSAN